MDSQDLKRFTLPDAPGIYFFKNGPKILYIGKATSLKDRVKSYFARDILMTRSPLIVKMLAEAKKIEFIETDSVLEALILEANEIKKHQPFYNSRKIIYHLRLFFEAKKPQLIKSLEKEMKLFAREQKFEDAEKVKRQIFSLKHIQDIALIKEQYQSPSTTLGAIRSTRIEAYDIAHMSGTNVVAVMTVVLDGELAKSQYRKFKIRLDSNDDILSLKEVLTRRLAHPEWRFPNLIVVDGGRGQLNAAREVLKKVGLDIAVASVVKDERHKAREIIGEKKYSREILLANSEAHRFAIGFHRRLRGKEFRI